MMSGTSVDGIDAALVDFGVDGDVLHARLVGLVERPFAKDFAAHLNAVMPPAGSDVATWCRLHTHIGQEYAQAAREAIAALGSADLVVMHGQTLFHWVEDGVTRGSLQAGSPAWVAEAVGVPVLSDLRAADIAAGGHGAPLAVALDALWLGHRPTAALNLGGIANVAVVGAGPIVCGDTGPANCLLDAVARRELGTACDEDGRIAASGRVADDVLARLLSEPYLARPLPKSTGRELFHLGWLDALLPRPLPVEDLLATLTDFTACSIARALDRLADVQRIVVSGGGTRNPHLMGRISAHAGAPVVTSDALGLPSQAKEAVLFALLGWLSFHGLPGLPEGATGARRATILGSLTPPTPLDIPRARPVARLVIDREEIP